MRIHLARTLVVSALVAILAGCGTDDVDPRVIQDTPTYTRAVIYVVRATHEYRDERDYLPANMIQKGDEYIVGSVTGGVSDNLNPTAPAAPGVRLAWYTASGGNYSFCLETDDTHYVADDTGDNTDKKKQAELGPCPTKPRTQ